MMKTLAVFGASGRSGKAFLKFALTKYKIKALVRDPRKILIENTNLEILKGDVLNENDIIATIRDADVVISLIGHTKNSPADLQYNASQFIITNMKKMGIKRLITLTGAGVRDLENDRPKFIDNVIVFIMKNLAGKGARNALLDGWKHAYLIKESELDWTIVRAPMLTNDVAKNKIEVGYVGSISGIKLSREDLALFILNEIEENKNIHKMPFLTNGK